MTARKLFIILVTVAALLVVYIIYGFFNTVPVFVTTGKAPDSNMSDVSGTMGKIGTTGVGPVIKSSYIDYDEHKNVKREFGFEKLLHESGNEWTIEKPYMNIIEKGFVCGITADTGKVQVEMAAGKVAPKDAQLSGNVVIHILPDKSSRMSESFVYLDDISYISEKSLFTTAGPVHFVSVDAEMVGRGLEVVYNTGRDRLELMQLSHLEFLRLKTFKESLFAKKTGLTQLNQPQSATTSLSEPSGGQKAEEQYYRCTLNKNVVINYGSQVILADDEATISNFFWPGSRETDDKKDMTADSAAPAARDTNGADVAKVSADKIIPVVITCQKGIIVRPMEETASTANTVDIPQRTLELKGTPVTIKANSIKGGDNKTDEAGNMVLVECGWLKYNLDLGILDMFSRGSRQNVSLNLERDGSKLETADSLTWSLKEHKAVVRGPGILYFGAKTSAGGQQQDADKARMNFGGTMNVAFADEPLPKSLRQAMNIKFVSLTGGFTAAMPNDKAHLAADSATMDFAGGNAISEANLDGNVNFSSDSGSLKSQKAKVFFMGGSAVSQADFDGSVNFNSNSGSAQSESAKVFFDKGNTVSEAQLNGNVNFDSATGSLKSQNAKVLFTKDSKGNVYASSIQSFGNVEIAPAAGKSGTPQGVFHAPRIDYDIPKGHAVAEGPVELTFHDANGAPMTITAKRKAEYFLKSNEVIFDGDIKGKMAKATANEYTDFRGDKLIAKLGRSNQSKAELDAAQSNIEHLSITGDVVSFESYQKQQDKVVGGITLKCRQIDYDGIKNAVWATGGRDCIVKIDNSKAPELAKTAAGFNLKGPCYALLTNFENLRWQMKDNRIVAEGVSGGMHLSAVPIVQGKDGQPIQIDTGHAQIDLIQMPDGRKAVSILRATDGIHYREEGSYELSGREFFYDGSKSLVSISGDSSIPCMANGVQCKSITINSNTGSAQMEGFTGGWLPVPPKQAK